MSQPDTKERLLDAAEKVFSRAGYEAATVKDIADTAGLNISLISYHFKGKEGIYLECVERFGKEGMQLIEKILTPPESASDLRTKIRLCIEQIIDCHIEDAQVCKLIHLEIINGLPHCKDVFRHTFHQAFLQLVKFFDLAKKKKIIRDKIDSHTIATTIFGSLIHFAQSDTISKQFLNKSITDPKHRRKVLDNLLDIILFGIMEEKNAKH